MTDLSRGLTTEGGVFDLMLSSETEDEWNDNCEKVKAANEGYPPFWFRVVIASGLGDKVVASWATS